MEEPTPSTKLAAAPAQEAELAAAGFARERTSQQSSCQRGSRTGEARASEARAPAELTVAHLAPADLAADELVVANLTVKELVRDRGRGPAAVVEGRRRDVRAREGTEGNQKKK